MSIQALLNLGAVGAGMALIIWAVSRMRTDPRGYICIATFAKDYEAERACKVLEHAGIAPRLDDHSYRLGWVWSTR